MRLVVAFWVSSHVSADGRRFHAVYFSSSTFVCAFIWVQDNQKDLLKLEEEKHTLSRECASLQELIKKLTLQVSAQDSQKVSELAQDLMTLKEKEKEIKSLKQQLSKKERLLESLNARLATQPFPSILESLRGAEAASRQATPRGSFGHLFSSVSSPRRTSVKHLLATPQPPSSEPGLSLATELQLTKIPSVTRRYDSPSSVSLSSSTWHAFFSPSTWQWCAAAAAQAYAVCPDSSVAPTGKQQQLYLWLQQKAAPYALALLPVRQLCDMHRMLCGWISVA